MSLYLFNCKICKDKTPHKICIISRKNGVKLKCCECGSPKSKYVDVITLQENEYKFSMEQPQ